jgi:hypothetical protein
MRLMSRDRAVGASETFGIGSDLDERFMALNTTAVGKP